MDKKISTLLQEIKTETGWSQTRIGQEIGATQPTVNRILKGQKECIGSTLRAIEALHRRTCAEAVAKVDAKSRRRKTPNAVSKSI